MRDGVALLLGFALLSAMVATAAGAQALPGATAPASGASLSSASAKSATASQGMGPVILPKDFSELRIEPGDLLSVNVYDAPEFTSSYRVDTAGDLTIPLCGKVNLRGQTLIEAAHRIEATFKENQILVAPQVSVDVTQYAGQYVTVLGEVGAPGRVALIAPTTLGEVLAEVGGLTPLASAHIHIRRGGDESAPDVEIPYARSQVNREAASMLLRPGDSVVVPRAGIVYVLGAVAKPGGYVMQEDGKLNVAEALAMSGGTILQANTGGLRVIRRKPDGTVLDFSLSYDGIAKGSQTPLVLEAQDIVYVPMSKVKATFSTATGILSAAASAAIIHP